MSKKTSSRKSMSLKDFYETAPGKAPIETYLPSKPGTALWDAPSIAAQDYPGKFAPPPRRDVSKQPSSFSKGSDHLGPYGFVKPGQHGTSGGFIKASYDHPSSCYRPSYHNPEQPIEGQSRLPGQDAFCRRPDQLHYAPQDGRDPSSYATLHQPPPPPPNPARRPPAPQPQPRPVEQAAAPPQVPAPSAEAVHVPSATPKVMPAAREAETTRSSKLAQEPAKVIGELASMQLEPEVVEQLPSSAPKNDWAEKMARSALEKMANGKSSLLTDSPPAASPLDWSEMSKLSSTAEEPAKAVVKPVQPADRPRLNLKPRSQLLTADSGAATTVQQPRVQDKHSSLTDDAERLKLQSQHLPVHTAGTEREQRPRLQLQARSKPLADTEANKDSGARKSIFGQARPREEVLKQRGVDPTSARSDRAPASGNSGSRPSSRAASVGSGMSEEDAWHTVSNKKAAAKQQHPAHLAAYSPVGSFDMADDVFFGTGRPSGCAFKSMPARSFENDHSFAAASGASFGYGGHDSFDANGTAEDDGPVFRRSLPVRTGQMF